MNTTEYFKRTIQAYLEERAMEDELFAAKYDNPDKNIDDCVTYILNWVQKSGCNGLCDDEIYGQAIHYYEEKDIEVGKPLNCQVSVNHHIKLTEEEKAQARQEAIRQYQQEQMNKMRNRDTAKRTSQRTETEVHQPSLFDTL
ncbi:PcfK-like family protein [Prevotella stercorea]|uniref:PcfK-like family protein n=1 Tax=Leyella stercorea TaxID=363265 RepID=UPI001C2BDBF0|nr:PcfK-like family protein [Leyella stercorea]MBU9899735.1 PcfK-like family protein [Leyella stercorea]MBU9947830.1 PcfK-like family protein [Leyella stercorea]